MEPGLYIDIYYTAGSIHFGINPCMIRPLAQELDDLETNGVEAYDSWLMCLVIVVAPWMCILAVNACTSELLNHLGYRARKYCRMCMVSLFIVVVLSSKFVRCACITMIKKSILLHLVSRELYYLSYKQMQEIDSEWLQKDKSKLRTEYCIKEDPNPMLHIPANLFQ